LVKGEVGDVVYEFVVIGWWVDLYCGFIVDEYVMVVVMMIVIGEEVFFVYICDVLDVVYNCFVVEGEFGFGFGKVVF